MTSLKHVFYYKRKKKDKNQIIYILRIKKFFRVAITQGCKDQASVLLTL